VATGTRRAKNAATTAVRLGGDVEVVGRVLVCERRRIGRMAGERIDAGDERGRGARAANDDPPTVRGVVDGQAGARVAYRRHVRRCLEGAARVSLPGRLRYRQAARAAARAPRGLRP